MLAGARVPVRFPWPDLAGIEAITVGDARESRDIASAVADARDGVDAFTAAL